MFISNKTLIITLSAALMLSGCGSEGSSGTAPTPAPTPAPTAFNLTKITPKYPDSTTTFTWGISDNATEYSLCRKDTSKPNSCDELATSTTTSAVVRGIGVIKNLTSEYFVIAKNSSGEKSSNERSLTPQELTPLIQHIKASNTDAEDFFGHSVALSLDGNTLAVGVPGEESNGTGVNPEDAQADDSAQFSGAVYLFRYSASTWTQEAYIKASNTDAGDLFGYSVALSSDGNTLAVGAADESSNGTGVNSGAQENNSTKSGAVYLFRYSASTWTQEAYIKASNTDADDGFGYSVALSSDGNTLAVGAAGESSNGTGIDPEDAQADDSAKNSGAVYLFRYSASTWTQEAYIKASNTDEDDYFGHSVALSSDGNTLAVGATGEDSNGTGGNSGAQENNSAIFSGAVYLFRYNASTWTQEAYIKASNTDEDDEFGYSVALSSDGNTLAVGAKGESSNGTGVNSEGAQENSSVQNSGAVYLFRYSASRWTQEAYIKASNTDEDDEFGHSVALSSDGNTLAVGAAGESSNGMGVNSEGAQENNSAQNSGAVYLY